MENIDTRNLTIGPTISDTSIDVSIIIPMYNVENLIAETINSLKINKCRFEVILINDGSTDGSFKKALEAISNDPRFIVLDQQNQGVSVARNKGLSIAKGKYITFVDSDDLILESGIDLLLNLAVEKGADYVYGGIKKFNKEKKWSLPLHQSLKIFSEGHKNILNNFELFYSLGPAGKLISKKLIDKTDGFPENIIYAEDQVLFFNILLQANKIYCVGQDVYLYRERDEDAHELSAMQQRDRKSFEYLLDMIKVISHIDVINENSNFDSNEKRKNLIHYYERAIKSDVWPLVIRILKYQPKKIYLAFNEIAKLIWEKDKDFISSIPAFRYFFIRVLSDQVFYIKGFKNFISYRNLLISLFDKCNDSVYSYFSKPTHYGSRWDDCIFIAKKPIFISYCYFLYLRPKKNFFYYFNRNKELLIKKILFPLFKLMPKNNKKIIFATSKNKPMGENFTAILEELKKQRKFEKYKIYKFLGVTKKSTTIIYRYYHVATAHTIFLEDYYNPFYGLKFPSKINVVQLWHACGAFKRFAHDAIGYQDANTEHFENEAHSFYTDIIISSPNVKDHYKSAFQTIEEKVYALGVPRTDIFFDYKKMARIKSKLAVRFPYLTNTKNILYAPTFRGNASERQIFNLPICWEKIATLPDNIRLIIKLHPAIKDVSPEIPDWVKHRVVVLSPKENINHWMIFCDALVTDYSSLIFEYSLLNKPIIFFPFDLSSYFDERGFYYSYNTYTFGPVVHSTEELISLLNKGIDNVIYNDKREKFKKFFMSSCDGNSALKIIQKYCSK